MTINKCFNVPTGKFNYCILLRFFTRIAVYFNFSILYLHLYKLILNSLILIMLSNIFYRTLQLENNLQNIFHVHYTHD